MPVGSHYLLRWYWCSIIKYAYGHYFSGAINMCCDLGALDLTSHTCLLQAQACFKSATSVFSRTNLVSLPSLTAPLNAKKFHSKLHFMAHWAFCIASSDFADWKMAFTEGQCFLCYCVPSVFGEVWGCHWKHAIFYIFAPCHQIRMRCSDHCSLWSCFFPRWFCLKMESKSKLKVVEMKSFGTDKAASKLPMLSFLYKNSETLHPMWGLSGFVFFYLRCLCSAISM